MEPLGKIKVMTIFGTRPEAIKMAPLILEMQKNPQFECVICCTGQHKEMLAQVLHTFQLEPDFNLQIMKQSQTLADISSAVIAGADKIIRHVQPDLVMVHGDTSTTLAGGLAAFYNKVPVAHIEAGLRSFDLYSPYPEEMNRVAVGRIASLHFAPTKSNRQNLSREGITGGIYVTVNTVIDSLHYMVREEYQFVSAALQKIDFSRGRWVLMTAHRRENLGEPMENICRAVRRAVEENPELHIVFPVHLNPAVRETVYSILGGHERISLTDPVDVQDMHNLIARCHMVLTDSGGIQEEAPALGKPVLVLRTETERPEAVKAGTVKLVGVREADIFENIQMLLHDEEAYHRMAHAANPYGDGRASERIVQNVLYWAGRAENPVEFTL